MGFLLFLIVVGGIVLYVVTLKKKREKAREEAIEDLKNSGAYKVAVKIKDELIQKGFSVGELIIDFDDDNARGNFSIYSEGGMTFSNKIYALSNREFIISSYNLRAKHTRLYRYAIQNNNIGLIVYSDREAQDVPQFLKIAADVIKESGYGFKHPDWIHEYNAKEYLNVMFQ